MESRLKEIVQRTQILEKNVGEKSAAKDVPLTELSALLKEYRVASEELTLHDLPYARSHGAETLLWAAHSRTNARFRKQLALLRKGGPAKTVETRKFTKLYLEFLKDSQRFYREHIQKLNARFGGIDELERVAHQVKSDATAQPSHERISAELKRQVLLSCHQALIYLGDLSRYRATERLDKEPAWGPAIGYYNLAGTLRPSSGMAFHQQSVIAFEEGDHLRAIYYLYRSIVVDEPHPNAIANLELEFRKVRKSWEAGELVPRASLQDRTGSRKALVAWFTRLHSKCYTGQPFSGHDELENEVLSRLKTELKQSPIDASVTKMCYINLAAQHTAATQFQNKPEDAQYMQSFFFHLRLNVNTFATLLQTYHADLDKAMEAGVDPKSDGPIKLPDKLTGSQRQLLPLLRLYSTWLLVNAQILGPGVGDDGLQQMTLKLWRIYAKTLSLIASAFPVQELPEVSYQLEEDVDSLGFKPLESERTEKLWKLTESGRSKPRFSDVGQERMHPNEEMLSRIRELLVDALLLAVDDESQFSFHGSNFVFDGTSGSQGRDRDLAQQALSQPQPTKPLGSPVNFSVRSTGAVPSPAKLQPTSKPAHVDAQDAQLIRMVDDLVDDDDDADVPTVPRPAISLAQTGPHFARHINQDQIQSARGSVSRRSSTGRPRTPGTPMQRLQSVSSLWDNAGHARTSPPGMGSAQPTTTHTRVNSAASIHSRSSPHHSNSLSSFDPTPPYSGALKNRHGSLAGGHATTAYQNEMHSPLLFGAGGGPWSTGPRASLTSMTPPNGQG